MSNPYRTELIKGVTFQRSLTRKNAAGFIDITGRTYSSQIRKNANDATPLATLTCTILNAATGQFKILLAHGATLALPETELVGSVVETMADGTKNPLFRIVYDVTMGETR